VFRYKSENIISGLAWNPKANSLAMIEIPGRFAIWENVIPKEFPNPFQATLDIKQSTSLIDELLGEEEVEEDKKDFDMELGTLVLYLKLTK
jgi:chromosome transmission fidelity protein 4